LLIFSPSESIASNLFADIFLVAFASFCQAGERIFVYNKKIKREANKWKSHSEEWLFPGLKIIANFFSERINCKQFIR